MTTGGSLTGSASVRKLQTVLHAKAKEEPDRRTPLSTRYGGRTSCWRHGGVRRNGGAAGVDGETVADVGAYGVERWVGELSRTYKPSPVRQVLIPKKQPGFRGIPCLRDRVAQTSRCWSCRRSSRRIWSRSSTDTGRDEAPRRSGGFTASAQGPQRSDRCGPLELLRDDTAARVVKSIARRVSDGRMLGLIKAWLEMPVVEEDGDGHTPQIPGAKGKEGDSARAISPLLSNIYMRRFIRRRCWVMPGRFGAIVNYADDFCVLGKAPAAEMLAVVNRRGKTEATGAEDPMPPMPRCLSVPWVPGWNYRPTDGSTSVPGRKASVQSICRISAHTGPSGRAAWWRLLKPTNWGWRRLW